MENKISEKVKQTGSIGLRNLVFGVEDGLVSTVGFVSGIATAGLPLKTILVSGIVLISVEAFSMTAGSFLSESSAEEFENAEAPSFKNALTGSLIMFFSYVIAGGLVLTPYFFLPTGKALWYSVALSFAALILLGTLSAKISGTRLFKAPLRMVIVGSLATLLGVAVAHVSSSI